MENHQPVTAIQSTSLHIWELFITYCHLDSMPIVLHHHLTGHQVIVGEDPIGLGLSLHSCQIYRRLRGTRRADPGPVEGTSRPSVGPDPTARDMTSHCQEKEKAPHPTSNMVRGLLPYLIFNNCQYLTSAAVLRIVLL